MRAITQLRRSFDIVSMPVQYGLAPFPGHVPFRVRDASRMALRLHLPQGLGHALGEVRQILPVSRILAAHGYNLAGYVSARQWARSVPQLFIDRLRQFAAPKDDFSLLARHGGVQVALVAEYAKRPVHRPDVIAYLRKAVTNALGLVEKISPLFKQPGYGVFERFRSGEAHCHENKIRQRY
ncbi:MAG: hypothetical protein AB7I34_07680 [Rhizobiaceae bacterium]